MNDNLRYSVLIQWSDDDDAYLVTLPEWEGGIFNPVTHGETYEEAVKSGYEALEALVASARKHNETLPQTHPFTKV